MKIDGIFSHCKLLKALPNISKWKLKNVVDMTQMFFSCESLNALPDISKWKTNHL